jgi:peroxiredoxin
VTHDPTALPAGLPVPEDDGAADHLPGAEVPSVGLVATDGRTIDLAERSRSGTVVVFAYPRTGRPGADVPAGWDEIPGARGCTPEACSFRDLSADFTAAGAELYGLSTQDPEYQGEAAERLALTYPLLSDEHLALAAALRLPTSRSTGRRCCGGSRWCCATAGSTGCSIRCSRRIARPPTPWPHYGGDVRRRRPPATGRRRRRR